MGRKRKGPWLRKQDNCYYTTIAGENIKLGSSTEPWGDIEERYAAELAKAKTKSQDRMRWTVAALVDEFLEWCQKRKSAATYKWYSDYLREFYAHIGSRMRASDLRAYIVTEWVDDRYRDCSDSTKYNATRAVVRVFNWAVEEGHLQRSPIKGIVKPTPISRESLISQTQFDEIIALVKDQQFRDALHFCWNTGVRPQEFRIIEARHVDGVKITLDRKQSKGKRHKRVIYCNDVAAEIVKRLATANPTGPIFLNRRGLPWSKDALNCRFRRLRKHTKIDGLCSYTLRHSYINASLKRGIDSLTVATLCGTSQLMIARVYQHLLKDDDFMLSAAQGAGSSPVVLATLLPSAVDIPPVAQQ